MLILLSILQPLQAQSTKHNQSDRPELIARLDSLAQAAADKPWIASLSVAVLKGNDTLLLKGYGMADMGLNVPATTKTRYRLVGPSTTMLAALLIQQVEQGNIDLDEDVTKHLPDFPWQGRRVTLRQLMDATSGLPDYHYLGDPYEKEIAVPKSQDEVTALFAGLLFAHEPGERQQWTISGFHLAGVLLERLTGKSFKELIEEKIVRPLGLENTCYCNGREIINDLAKGYDGSGDSLLMARPESPSMYPFTVTVCASAGDVAYFFRTLRQGELIKPQSYQKMISLSPAAEKALEFEGEARVLGMDVKDINGRKVLFERGGLHIGYGSAAFYLPEDDITVVVLKNTAGTGTANSLGQDLITTVLGLELQRKPESDISRELKDLPLKEEEFEKYVGFYRVTYVDPYPPQYAYKRTYRVYEENGRLMLQAIGDVPEPLFRQKKNTFFYTSDFFTQVSFTIQDERANEIIFQFDGSVWKKGPRIEEAEGENRKK